MQIVYYVVILTLVSLCGYPLARLITDREKPVELPVIFIMGMSSLVFILYWLSYLGVSMNIACYPVIVAIPIIGFILCKKFNYELKVHIDKKGLLILILCASAGACAMIPGLVYHGEFIYGDTYTYVCIADFLTQM